MRVNGIIKRFKAQLVIRNLNQRHGINYFDTYAPVVRIATSRVLITLATIQKLVIHQMDVKTALLNAELEEHVYRKQPKGFVILSQERKIHKLMRFLYGLKQAAKQ